jgi:hypothetical protein
MKELFDRPYPHAKPRVAQPLETCYNKDDKYAFVSFHRNVRDNLFEVEIVQQLF